MSQEESENAWERTSSTSVGRVACASTGTNICHGGKNLGLGGRRDEEVLGEDAAGGIVWIVAGVTRTGGVADLITRSCQ